VERSARARRIMSDACARVRGERKYVLSQTNRDWNRGGRCSSDAFANNHNDNSVPARGNARVALGVKHFLHECRI